MDNETVKKILELFDKRIGYLYGDIYAYKDDIEHANPYDVVSFTNLKDTYNNTIAVKDELEDLYEKIIDLK